MRFLLVLVVFALAGCGSSSEDSVTTRNTSPEEMETAADDAQETINSSFEKAEGVEDVLQDAAKSRDAAIEESTDNN
jgi:hypothetical protein